MKRLAVCGLLVLAALLAPSCSKKPAAQAGRIVAPADTVDSGAVITPKVVVHNLGGGDETFPVLLRIGTLYTDTENVTGLAANDSATVSFKDWTASPVGELAVTCSTMLSDDNDPSDDRVTGTVVVLSGLEADLKSVGRLAQGDTDWFNTEIVTDTTHDTTGLRFPADTVLHWWRSQQTHDTAVVTVSVSGDSAFVHFSRTNHGYIYSLIKTPDTTVWRLWTRPVTETRRVNGVYLRAGQVSDTARGWKLLAVSLAMGTSDSATNTVQIDSVRIMSATTGDLVITDPLNTYFNVDSLVRFASAEPCSVVVYANTSDGNVFLHTFVGGWYVRAPFDNAGSGVYTHSWTTQLLPRPRFAIFDLLNHKSLYTPDYPYDSNGWQLPYVIKNTL